MNQLHVYDPELFHPSLTHSVLAVLDGATLKLSYPKSNIPRRATFEEEILDTVFVSHRCYDLTDAKVSPEVPRTLPWGFPPQLARPHPALGAAGLPVPPQPGPKEDVEQEISHLCAAPRGGGGTGQERRGAGRGAAGG